MKFRAITIAFSLITGVAYSAWDPSYISQTASLSTDKEFDSLKTSVYKYLTNSWVSQEKAQLLMELIFLTKPQICVDIGSFNGSSALPVAATLKHIKNGKIYLIEAWSNEEAVKYIKEQDPNYFWWATLDMNSIKNQCLKVIDSWSLKNYCQVIHSSSEQAVDQIGQIDFLHLDGNFSQEGSLLDVTLYLPKVKSGGYILLSNACVTVDQIFTKANTMWALYYECEIVAELENGNTLLFKKQ